MKSFKNVLVATDFSNNAYCALFYAAKLLESRPCCFYILHTFTERTPLAGKRTSVFGGRKLIKSLQAESNEKLAQTFHKIVLDRDNSLHKFQTISMHGDLVKCIGEMIDEKDIDLVVMGNKGATGAKEIFLGSNTIQTVHAMSKCAVLAIPGEPDFKPPREIAFITDYKVRCDANTLAPLLQIRSLVNASIRIMHINEENILDREQEANRLLLTQCLSGIDHTFHRMQHFTHKAKVIDVFLEKLKINMFAMMRHKHSFLEKLIREPVLNDVSIYSDIPFLILPAQD